MSGSSHFAISDSGPFVGFVTEFERGPNETATIKNWPVFKAGTFRDSRGREQTWTHKDLDDLAANFTALQPYFPRPPVRADHGRSVDGKRGHTTSLRREGDFLLADVALTEPDAVGKFERGTYSERSSEIGAYQTNSGEVVSPTFLGVAFVDIPAVEGLFSKEHPNEDQINYFTEAFAPMSGQQAVSDKAPGTHPPGQAQVVVQGNTILDPATQFAQGGVVAPAGYTINGTTTGTTTNNPILLTAAPAAPAPEAAPVEPVKFNFGGEEIDADGIQAKLDEVAAFQQQVLDLARTEFAAKLVAENKFTAPQEEKLGAFFKSLSAEQFGKAQEVYAAAPELSILGNHASGVSNPNNADGGTTNERDEQIALHEGVIKQFSLAGKSQADIAKTDSFKALQALKAQS